jgi:hypothetical protein
MSNPPEELIEIKHTLKTVSDKQLLIDRIIKFITAQFTNIFELKYDPELTLAICNIIEDQLPNNNKKIDKKDLLLNVLKQVFVNYGWSNEDTTIIEKQLEHFISRGKIKGIRISKKILKYVGNWFFRTFL